MLKIMIRKDEYNSMKKIFILIVDDSVDDYQLVVRQLKQAGFDIISKRIDNASEFESSLEENKWQVILCDYVIPGFGGMEALNIYKEKKVDIPFIIITGNINDQLAVAAMHEGAHDYLMKDNLDRLAPVIERELLEFNNRERASKAERNLELSENKFKNYINHAPDAIFVTNSKGFISEVNPTACTMTGHTYLELLNTQIFDLYVSENKNIVAQQLKTTLEKGKYSGETQFIKKDTTVGWWHIDAVKMTSNKMLFFFNDITKRKQAEKLEKAVYDISEAAHSAGSLKELYYTVHNIVKSVMPADSFFIALYNKDLNIVTFPYNTDEKDSKPVQRERGKGLTEYVLSSGKTFFGTKIKVKKLMVRKEVEQFGEPAKIWLGVPLKINNVAIGVMAVQHYTNPNIYTKKDIKIMEYVSSQVAIAIERKRSEIQIKEEKDRAKLYLDIAVVMLIALDRNGKIILVNKMTLELLKYEENELLGKNWFEVCVSSKERDTVENRFHQIMKGKRKPSTEFENTVLTSKGRSRTIVWNTEVLRDEKGEINGLLSSGKDITQKLRNEKKNKELSAQLIQSQKLESIGTLASGVAHEINNPLTVIINYAEMMMAYENLDEKLNKCVKEIIKEGYRVAQIVKSLLAFSKAEVGFFSRTTLKSIVDSSISLVDSVLFSEQILCTIDIAENLEEIQCQGQQIQQVIMNLITNARYELNQKFPSWDDNKRIHIIVRPFKRKNVKWQRLTIEDFGPGISEETQKRIFEPFYSTKPADSGTGLGLAVSYGIIREHNGKLWVESEIGKYTRFHVELPVDNEDLEY